VHFALEEPHFLPDARALRGLIIVESPPAFRARLIFTRVEPLARARFPRDAPRAQVPLAWPPSAESAESPPGNHPELPGMVRKTFELPSNISLPFRHAR
jgi:hypothetical protein